ncbi:hypothetical protein BJ741DRAFT_586042 [Chytriomyces cf. hyalinus JEL632]|nr:hypothetical protein BJ741DRAFT_586042 [Chytriomyces cf. hyalinus JEL632]
MGVAACTSFAGLGQYRTTGFTCLFAPGNAAIGLSFAPLGLIAFPSLSLNFWTVAHILNVQWLAQSSWPISIQSSNQLMFDSSTGKNGENSVEMSACPSTVGLEASKAGVAKAAFLKMAETVKASARSMGLTMQCQSHNGRMTGKPASEQEALNLNAQPYPACTFHPQRLYTPWKHSRSLLG